MSRITQLKAAKELGISQSVISRILSNPDTAKASEETKERVLAYFRKNSPWKLPAAAPIPPILVACPSNLIHPSYWITQLLSGVEQEARHHGIPVRFHQWVDPARMVNEVLAGEPLYGLIHINDLPLEAPGMRKLLDAVPCVALGTSPRPYEYDVVSSDHQAGVDAAIALLRGHGHSRIAFLLLGSTPELGYVGKRRIAEVVGSLQYHGCVIREDLIVTALAWNWDDPQAPATLGKLLQQVLSGVDAPTALLCFNDYTALLTMRILQEKGFNVPRDISVIGFDNLDAGLLSQPPLTTIAPDRERLGKEAVRLLRARGTEPRGLPPIRIQAPTPLVVRGSVGPASDPLHTAWNPKNDLPPE